MPVSENYPIRLARRKDARQIAILYRNLIEAGLGWSWTPARVVHSINSKNSDVILAYDKKNLQLAGFAIMEFHQQYAHLNLLAVRPEVQGCGIGKEPGCLVGTGCRGGGHRCCVSGNPDLQSASA